MHLRRLI